MDMYPSRVAAVFTTSEVSSEAPRSSQLLGTCKTALAPAALTQRIATTKADERKRMPLSGR